VRTFDTGATRDSNTEKYDYEGFLSPLVEERFAQYMHKHRKQADGSLRDSDNWQRGIPLDAYMESMFRHFFDVWKEHRGFPTKEGLEEALCALKFNVNGYLHETLKGGKEPDIKPDTSRVSACAFDLMEAASRPVRPEGSVTMCGRCGCCYTAANFPPDMQCFYCDSALAQVDG